MSIIICINRSLMKKNIKNTDIKTIPFPHPDWQDLYDWGNNNHPEVMIALKYITENSKYDCLLELWHKDGRKTKGFSSALWTEKDENERIEPNKRNCADNNDYHGFIDCGR